MRFKRASVAAAVAALSAGALVTGASPAGATAGGDVTATACYDTQSYFSKPDGTFRHPRGYFRTTSACNDINIKLDSGAEVRVCFETTGCQAQYKWAARGQWTTIATNVRDNVYYYLSFNVAWVHSGYIAD